VTLRVVIAGGGTAGHVYPGLALAAALQRAMPDADIAFAGTTRGIETTAVPAAGFPLELLDVVPWSKTIGAARYLVPVALARATVQARRLLRARRPHAVVGMGGYASMPVVLAARSKRTPIVLHEQNAIPGLANVAGARVTHNIALTFEEARGAFPRGTRIRVTGNPIRQSIATLERDAVRAQARAELGLAADRFAVVVFGGSLGAATLNAAAAGLAAMWEGRADRQLLVIAGLRHGEHAHEAASHGAVVLDYVERMEMVYAAADLVVARAGATTVAEIAAVGLPAVLVPYPYARRDHQRANAAALAKHGGAFVIPDADATAGRLARMIDGLVLDPSRLRAMGEASKRFGRPNAAARLAEWVLELAEGRP